MRSCALWIVACAALLAGSNADPITLEVGETFPTSITTMLAEGSFSCQLRTPAGETVQFRPENLGDPDKYTLRDFNMINGCAVDVKVTGKSDEGTWELSFTPNTNVGGSSRSYVIAVNATEVAQDPNFESPDEPTVETTSPPLPAARPVEYLPEQFFNTSVGSNLNVKILYHDFVNTESCYLETPEGIVHNLNAINIEGIKVIEDREVACGVEIQAASDLVGNWTLFSHDTRFSSPIERRLNFAIYIEEFVTASPEEITIKKGNNLYVRLENSTNLHETCKLISPNEDDDVTHTIDENHKEECGFIVPNVQMSYTGRWEIVYGDRIVYKAPIEVTVNAADEEEEESIHLEWLRDRPVDTVVGPENAVYCRMSDPTSRVVFEGFERCRIALDRVSSQHSGTWLMTVGVPGRVLTQERAVTVNVVEAASRPRVITRVEKQSPEVLLTCSLEGQHTINTCKFREPSGRVLLASQGIGEDRYSFHGVNVRLESTVSTTDCGLRITNPVSEDMGLWRCAMETDSNEVYYGFLTVICPFAISQPDAPPVVTEPTLAASHSEVEGVEGEAVTMSCAVQSEIRYCYFRARNGTIFNVSPGTTSTMFEYAGAGFDAGECSIKFSSLEFRDTGAWSCHVGLPDASLPEQRSTFNLRVQRPINAHQSPEAGGLQVTGTVYDSRPLEYCRFVRIDGLGFTSENVPEGVTDIGSLSEGICSILIAHPTMLDHHPWTVAAKIVGQDVEVSDSTDHSIEMPDNVDPIPPLGPHGSRNSFSMMWILIVLLSLSFTLLTLNLITRRHQQWAQNKVVALRDSFRRKKPLADPVPSYAEATNAA